jgi:medium-chain acyl-[acyl-carrier-protein] hydrolase
MPDHLLKRRATEDIPPQFEALKTPQRKDFELPFKVRMHDLDLNGHVNNAIYLEWAVETVPRRILLTHQPENIEVIFQRESLYGDKILSRTEIVPLGDRLMTYHLIMCTKTDTERARINILWRPAD